MKRFIFAFFILFVSLSILLVLASAIPSSLLKQNVGNSLRVFQTEGQYPSVGVVGRQIVLDDYTDSLMMNTAYSVNSLEPVRSAVADVRYASSPQEINQIVNLESSYQGKKQNPVSYERYWHGYLTFLRPALTVLSYSEIRILLLIISYVLCAAFLYLVGKKIGVIQAIIFFTGLQSVDFFYLGQSLQFSGVFLIGLSTSIYLLLTERKNTSQYLLFFITGAATSYVDLLTAPLVSLGLLLTTAYLLRKKRNVVALFGSWSVGYALFWISKILLAQVTYFPHAVQSGFSQMVDRMVGKADANFTLLTTIKLNLFQLIGYARQSKIAVLVGVIILTLFLIRYHALKKEKTGQVVPLLIIAVIPYLWYLIVANHSYLHVWYTYRAQLMSVTAFLLILSEFTNWKKVQQDWTKLKSLR